jgi:phosphomethylpyrimidine synthase
MCGHDWCSVRISKEIQQFVSGSDNEYAWDKPKISAALTQTQKEILQKRGVLTPGELHRLATKTRKQMSDEGDRADCHSDTANATLARTLQQERMPEEELPPNGLE